MSGRDILQLSGGRKGGKLQKTSADKQEDCMMKKDVLFIRLSKS